MPATKVAFYRHHLGAAEAAALAEVLEGLFLTTGPRCRAFEVEFSRLLGVPHVVTTSSCTSALVLALAAFDVGPGDEVITTPATFIATPNAILHRGATPVFADVDQRTGNLDPDRVRAAITPRTRAIIAVHLYGQMCDVAALRAIADEAKLVLIEDAAHCVEGRFGEVGPGQLGDAACFSFYATKNLTCGEGGAVAVHSEHVADRLCELRMLGMSRSAADRFTAPRYVHWDMLELGYKANLSDLNASVLLSQLAGLEARLARREEIARRYETALAELGIGHPQVLPGCRSARHLFTLWVDGGRRDDFLAEMGESGIGVAVNYRPVHLTRYYRERFGYGPGAFPVAERIGEQTASLPMYPLLTDSEVEQVICALRRWAG